MQCKRLCCCSLRETAEVEEEVPGVPERGRECLGGEGEEACLFVGRVRGAGSRRALGGHLPVLTLPIVGDGTPGAPVRAGKGMGSGKGASPAGQDV